MGKKLFNKIVRIVLPLVCGVALFGYIYADLDKEAVMRVLCSEIDYSWIILSMGIGVVSHVMRALRWRLQLNALQIQTSFSTVLNAIFGTYAVNLLFPRLGEVWRCGYVARRGKASFTQLLGSVVSDRLADSLTVLVLLMTVFFWQMPLLMRFLEKYPELSAWLSGIIGSPAPYFFLGLFFVLALFLYKAPRMKGIRQKIAMLMQNVVTGILSVVRMQHKWLFLAYTLLIWGCYYLQLWVCFFAFDYMRPLGGIAALVLFVAGSLGTALPVQGGIGPWHFAVITALSLYGIGENEAGAFALVAHGAQLLVVVLLGFYTIGAILLEKKISNSKEQSV